MDPCKLCVMNVCLFDLKCSSHETATVHFHKLFCLPPPFTTNTELVHSSFSDYSSSILIMFPLLYFTLKLHVWQDSYISHGWINHCLYNNRQWYFAGRYNILWHPLASKILSTTNIYILKVFQSMQCKH